MIDVKTAVQYLKQGKVIAYPTEAVYGLGCDPKNQDALNKILAIKSRSANKGLILIAASVDQLDFYIDWSIIPTKIQHDIKQSWPGFITWLLPINQQNLSKINPILYGQFDTIAVRVTNHSVVQQICKQFNGPIISTSANTSGNKEIKDGQVMHDFVVAHTEVAGVVLGDLGGYEKPSTIIHGLTGEKIR